MNLLTEEEMKFCTENIDVIEKIVISSACSCIPPDYLEGLREINKKYHYTSCITCNSSIFISTNRLYKDFLYSKEEYLKINLKNSSENERKGRNKRNSKEKG